MFATGSVIIPPQKLMVLLSRTCNLQSHIPNNQIPIPKNTFGTVKLNGRPALTIHQKFKTAHYKIQTRVQTSVPNIMTFMLCSAGALISINFPVFFLVSAIDKA